MNIERVTAMQDACARITTLRRFDIRDMLSSRRLSRLERTRRALCIVSRTLLCPVCAQLTVHLEEAPGRRYDSESFRKSLPGALRNERSAPRGDMQTQRGYCRKGPAYYRDYVEGVRTPHSRRSHGGAMMRRFCRLTSWVAEHAGGVLNARMQVQRESRVPIAAEGSSRGR